MSDFDPMDFQPNSGGVMVVRVIRIKDIVRSLDCTEDFAREVIREIRGATTADGTTAFVLPSQLAAWAYKRAGKPVAPFPSRAVFVNDAGGRGDALRRAASRAEPQPASTPTSGATSLKEIRSDLRRLKSATIQPGAVAITIEQAAARLGCAKTKVFDLLKSGELKRGKKVGKKSMVLLSSVDGFTAEAVTVSRTPTKAKAPSRPETAAEILRNLKQRL